ncbi:MAG: AAA family ATPase [Planctomycetota bacterium]|nr:AAA family ATPase [Planctomycetota bacterium]
MRIFSESSLARTLGRALELPTCNPLRLRGDSRHLRTVPQSFASKQGCLPIGLRQGRLLVAAADPCDAVLQDDLSAMTGLPVDFAVATRSSILRAIKQWYDDSTASTACKIKTPDTSAAGLSISVISNKGGVGKTHAAINLAYSFDKACKRTLLIDGDTGNANLTQKLGLFPFHTLTDYFEKNVEFEDTIQATKHGFEVVPGRTSEGRMNNMKYFQRLRLLKAFHDIKNQFDCVIYDLGAGVSQQVLDFALNADQLVVVTTPRDLVAGYACLKLAFLRHAELEKRRTAKDEDYRPRSDFSPAIVINQCGTIDDAKTSFGRLIEASRQLEHARLEELEGFSISPFFLGALQFDPDGFVASERARQPYLSLYDDRPNGHYFRLLARNLFQTGAQSTARASTLSGCPEPNGNGRWETE